MAMNKGLVSISVRGLCERHGEKEGIRRASELGVDAIDFSLVSRNIYNRAVPDSIYAKSDEEIYEHFKALGDYARSLRLVIGQTHGESQGLKSIPKSDELMAENLRRDILATSALGAPICVVHTVSKIFLGADADPNLMRDLNFKQFTDALPFAKEMGVNLATETFGNVMKYDCCDFFGKADEFIKGYNRIAAYNNYEFADSFGICVDTGHSNRAHPYGQPSAADVIRMCGSNVKALHLNDNDSFMDQHKVMGSGTIDWKDVFDALEEIDYKGTYNLELNLYQYGADFMDEYAAFSIKVLREMLRQREL